MAATRVGFLTLRYCGLDRWWLVDSNSGKTQLVLFDQCNNTGAIDINLYKGSVHEEKPSFKMPKLTFFSKLG